MPIPLRLQLPPLDDLLVHAGALGGALDGYRNHPYRVANLCAALAPGSRPLPAPQIQKIALAAGLHDLGIWTDATFDYLPPSIRLTEAHLTQAGLGDWAPEVTAMIREHHKITRWRGAPAWLVEPFRRADWADVSRGVLARGLPRGLMRTLYARWPSAGFHRRLLQLELARLRSHPFSPLPMLRL